MPKKCNLSLVLFFLLQLGLSGCVKNKDQRQESVFPQDEQSIRHGHELFDQYCASCHNFQENGIGPNLTDVTAKESPEWLVSFIGNAPQMIDNGDQRAVELYKQYHQYMPAFPMLQKDEIASLLAYVHTQQDTGKKAEKERKNRADSLANPIPEKIPSSDLSLVLEKVLTVPASAENSPLARINKMIAVEGAQGDRLFVHDLRGKLYEIKGSATHVYLDLTQEEPKFIEHPGLATGFGSFAFHPDFKNNGLFYTTHTEPKGAAPADFPIADSIPVVLQWVLTEWKVNKVQAQEFKGTHREMLRVDMYSGIHGFQDVEFNPLVKPGDVDYGMLYLGVGEGGAALGGYPFLCHDKGKIWGTVLRIDPAGKNSKNGKYGIPKDNPWVNDPGALGESWAYGFRNPHRICWDLTGSRKMLITNIGQSSVEEVNLGIPGADYGWPVREGTFVYDLEADPDMVYPLPPDDPEKFAYPVAQYDHDEGNAISGGYVYAGNAIPLLKGKYMFGDIVSGRVFYTENKEMQQGQQAQIHELGIQINGKDTDLRTLTVNKRVDLRFGMDGKGELYILTKSNGAIYKVADCQKKKQAL